jgi:hypothetical protein
VNISRKCDGSIESLDVKYLSSGEIASVPNLSSIKPYQSKFLRSPKAESVEEKKTDEKQADTEKSSVKLETTVKQEEKQEKPTAESVKETKIEEKLDTEKISEKLEPTMKHEMKIEEKQEIEKSSEQLETSEKQEKKTEEKQEKSPETEEKEATQDPAEKQDSAGLTRQALKFVERRHARRNLSPRSSRRRVRRITKAVAPPQKDVEPETKPEQATLDAQATPTRPSRPPRLASTPDCMKLYEADKHAAISVPVSTPEFTKNYEAEKDAAVSVPVSSPDFTKNYAAEKDAAISVQTDPAAGSALVDFQATSLPEINPQATALLPDTREVVMGEHQTKGINSDNFYELVSESKDLLKGTNTQNDKCVPADKNLLNSAPEHEILMNRSTEEPFPSTPQRSMETKVDTSWTESPCPISTPRRLLYSDEASPAKAPPRDITPPTTRRVDGQVMYGTESPSVEIMARVAPHPVSTPPRSEKEASFETSSVVSTPRKNNTSSQDATLETLEDTDRSGEMENNASLETTLSATSVPTEENTAEENEENKISTALKMGKTVSYLHTLLVGEGDSYSLDTASDSLDTASIEEMDRSNSYDLKPPSATPAPTEADTAKQNVGTKIEAKEKTGNTVSYLHTLLVGEGDSYSIGTTSLDSIDYNTDQSATDDDMDERSTCSEELPRSKKMERDDIPFEFCSSDTMAADFRIMAKLLARTSILFTGECPPEGRVPKKRFAKRRARRTETVRFADSVGDSKTSSAATDGLVDYITTEPDYITERRFAC